MANYKTIRVFPDGNEWVAKKDGTSRASVVKKTKEEAYKAAREIAINQGLTIIIHGKDGRIQKTVQPQEASSDGCFITTACVKYYHLDDDCYQLQTLRNFRDNYLLQSQTDKLLVKKYYSIAPSLVIFLENDPNKEVLFKTIFSQINDACSAIEAKNFKKAKAIYKKAIIHLSRYFKVI